MQKFLWHVFYIAWSKSRLPQRNNKQSSLRVKKDKQIKTATDNSIRIKLCLSNCWKNVMGHGPQAGVSLSMSNSSKV